MISVHPKTINFDMMKQLLFLIYFFTIFFVGNIGYAQTDFVFEEKEKKKENSEKIGKGYDESFQSIGIQTLGMKDGDTPLRWFVSLNNGNLIVETIGLYLEQQFILQIAGSSPYTFLGNGVFWYIVGDKRFGITGRANIGASFVSDINNTSFLGSTITGFGSNAAIGLSVGEGSFNTNVAFVVHQTSLLGFTIAPGANFSVLFKL